MGPQVDLVLVFRSSASGSSKVQPKALARQNARQASEQYAKLLNALRKGGLQAVGKRGERDGQLLVLVSCPSIVLKRLAQRERYVLPVLFCDYCVPTSCMSRGQTLRLLVRPPDEQLYLGRRPRLCPPRACGQTSPHTHIHYLHRVGRRARHRTWVTAVGQGGVGDGPARPLLQRHMDQILDNPTARARRCREDQSSGEPSDPFRTS